MVTRVFFLKGGLYCICGDDQITGIEVVVCHFFRPLRSIKHVHTMVMCPSQAVTMAVTIVTAKCCFVVDEVYGHSLLPH